MQSSNPFRQFIRSPTVVKIVGTTLLTLVLLIPLQSIENLVEERSQRQQEVTDQLQQQWGPPVTIRGPILAVPTRGTDQHRYLIPSDLGVEGSVPVVERYRGIFKLPTYRSELTISGHFSVHDLMPARERRTEPAVPMPSNKRQPKLGKKPRGDDLDTAGEAIPQPEPHSPSDLLWDQASWVLVVAATEAPIVQASVTSGDSETPLELAQNLFGISSTILHAPISMLNEGTARFTAKVEAFGSGALHIAPLGQVVEVKLNSDWSHPSFDGARLPTARTVDEKGFRANWDLNASLLGVIPSYLGNSLPSPMAQSPEISVRLLDGISHYQQVTRGVKYAMLVISPL